jgi:hypothetical protein
MMISFVRLNGSRGCGRFLDIGGPVKYVILIYSNPESREIWANMPADERRVGLGAYEELNAELEASGELIVTEALVEPSRARRVSVSEGRTVTSDGPFPEAKELLGGFYLVDCASEERATEIAARIPEAYLGLVELRPVMGSLEDFLS